MEAFRHEQPYRPPTTALAHSRDRGDDRRPPRIRRSDLPSMFALYNVATPHLYRTVVFREWGTVPRKQEFGDAIRSA